MEPTPPDFIMSLFLFQFATCSRPRSRRRGSILVLVRPMTPSEKLRLLLFRDTQPLRRAHCCVLHRWRYEHARDYRRRGRRRIHRQKVKGSWRDAGRCSRDAFISAARACSCSYGLAYWCGLFSATRRPSRGLSAVWASGSLSFSGIPHTIRSMARTQKSNRANRANGGPL